MRSKLIFGLALVLIIIAGVISLYDLAYVNKIYPYVAAGSVDISNLTVQQAEKRLRKMLVRPPTMIKLVFGNQEWPLDLLELQIQIDFQTTAERAFLRGRSQGFGKDLILKWQQWWQKENLPIAFSVDEEKLKATVTAIADAVEEKPIKPALILDPDGKINLIPGKNGRLVEKGVLIQEILKQLGALKDDNINIPIQLIKIEVSAEELIKAQTRAETIKDNRLTIKYGDFSREIKGQELIDLIGWKNNWDEEKIANLTTVLGQSLNRPAQNAVFQFDSGRVIEFKPALNGIVVDEAETRKRVKIGLDTGQTVEIATIISEPKIKTEQVNRLGIKELIGKGESFFYHSIPGRIHNVVLTAEKLNGVLVAPGETFSFNETVGDISRATGYQAAYVIKEGRTVLGDGGGVCQDSTTLFRAVLNAGLEIVERKPHAYRVSYYENNAAPGFDATVFAPAPDFKFKNDTPAHILVQASVDLEKMYLKIEFYGTSDGRISTISNIRLWDQTPPPAPLYQDDPTLAAGVIKQVDWPAWGAKAAFDWKVTKNGETLHETTFYSNYRPWQAVYLRGTKI